MIESLGVTRTLLLAAPSLSRSENAYAFRQMGRYYMGLCDNAQADEVKSLYYGKALLHFRVAKTIETNVRYYRHFVRGAAQMAQAHRAARFTQAVVGEDGTRVLQPALF